MSLSWEQIFTYLYEKMVGHVFGNPLVAGLWIILVLLGAGIGLGLDLSALWL
jgi:hypothetical protein